MAPGHQLPEEQHPKQVIELCRFTRAAYDVDHAYGTIRYRTEMQLVGQSSLLCKHTYTSAKTGSVVYTTDTLHLGRLERMAEDATPNVLEELLAGFPTLQEPIQRLLNQRKPASASSCHTVSFLAQASDEDVHGLMNPSAFSRMWLDAASTLAKQEKFRNPLLQGDLAYHLQICDVNSLYLGEADQGDAIHITAWDEAGDAGAVNFIAEKDLGDCRRAVVHKGMITFCQMGASKL